MRDARWIGCKNVFSNFCAGLKKSGNRFVGCRPRAAGWGCDAGRIGFGHRCRIAKTRVFGPDIGVESQKRVFTFIFGPDIGVEMQKRENWGPS